MVTPAYDITCTAKRKLTSDVYELVFTKPEGFTFKAGQFVLFDVPLLENPADIQTRAYSIASAPHEEDLLFVIKLIPGGRFSLFLEERLEVGTVIHMKGPFGFFTLDAAPNRSIIFVCTSTGNAPFRSMMLAAIEHGDHRPMTFLFGVRSPADAFWIKEFEDLAAAHPHIHFHLAYSQPAAGWEGLSGRVQSVLPLIIPAPAGQVLYACGNPGMTADIKRLALEEWGIPKSDLHVEGYM